MRGTKKISSGHKDRVALIYVRQSSMAQVRDHTESTDRQYALVDEVVRLGWPRAQVEVIDADLGLSGGSAEHRSGFKDLVGWTAVNSDTCSGEATTSVRRSVSSTGAASSSRNGVHGSPFLQTPHDSRSWTRVLSGTSTDTFPAGRTPRSSSDRPKTTSRANSSSHHTSGATVMRSTSGLSRNPMARILPPRLQVRTAAANTSAPNRQCQPKSPGCSWIGVSSRCQLRRARTTSSSSSALGVFNSMATRDDHSIVTPTLASEFVRVSVAGRHPERSCDPSRSPPAGPRIGLTLTAIR